MYMIYLKCDSMIAECQKSKIKLYLSENTGEKQTEAMEQTTVYYIKVPLHWATPNLQTAATLCIYAL